MDRYLSQECIAKRKLQKALTIFWRIEMRMGIGVYANARIFFLNFLTSIFGREMIGF
jgi:hypothetical protein